MTSVFVGLAILIGCRLMSEVRLEVNEPRLDTLSKSNGGRGGAHHRELHGKRLLDGNCDRERIVSAGGISGSGGGW